MEIIKVNFSFDPFRRLPISPFTLFTISPFLIFFFTPSAEFGWALPTFSVSGLQHLCTTAIL